MSVIQPSTSEAPVLEDGLYTVVCSGVEEKTVENDQFGRNDKVVVHLKIDDKLDENGDPIVIDPMMNRAWSEKATLFHYAQAFGLDPDPMQAFDTNSMVGRKAQALIATEKEGAWPKVRELLPFKKGAGPSPRPVLEEVVEPDFDGFWKRVRAGGYDRKEVAPYVDGDLSTLPMKTQNELNAILKDMGV